MLRNNCLIYFDLGQGNHCLVLDVVHRTRGKLQQIIARYFFCRAVTHKTKRLEGTRRQPKFLQELFHFLVSACCYWALALHDSNNIHIFVVSLNNKWRQNSYTETSNGSIKYASCLQCVNLLLLRFLHINFND